MTDNNQLPERIIRDDGAGKNRTLHATAMSWQISSRLLTLLRADSAVPLRRSVDCPPIPSNYQLLARGLFLSPELNACRLELAVSPTGKDLIRQMQSARS
jgi:hypothetical protein